MAADHRRLGSSLIGGHVGSPVADHEVSDRTPCVSVLLYWTGLTQISCTVRRPGSGTLHLT